MTRDNYLPEKKRSGNFTFSCCLIFLAEHTDKIQSIEVRCLAPSASPKNAVLLQLQGVLDVEKTIKFGHHEYSGSC